MSRSIPPRATFFDDAHSERNQTAAGSFSVLDHEKAVVQSAQQGSTEAFGRLYDHYLPKIYRFIVLKVSTKLEAEDLTHETFLSAWQNIMTYKEQGFPFSSWLYHIARNKVIDHYRTKKTHVQIETIEEPSVQFVKALDETIDIKFAFTQAQGALKQLTQDQQDVIIMRFVEDLSPREIATAIGKSEGAVRIIQHRAITTLKKIFSEEHYEAEF